ncbi:unnamed protein product [Parnassius apollo]|uniref:(apollo) hypothetical protein n=1 Tax=Parnassius apollo TaxID=110799 RepID=A0A8S3W3B1_PARAO|nr:unnamed protein product [Parnassius apollo]
MRGVLWAAAAAALLALAAPERRADTDFEFDDAPEAHTARSRRPRRYVYDPQNPLCRELVCKKREVCLLRDAFTAQCATKKDVLRRGDTIVAARRERGDDDDVFYEAAAPARAADNEADVDPDGELDNEADHDDELDHSHDRPPERCVGCGGAAAGSGTGAQFVCGSDNRTYSSLCRLALHNCVRRQAKPVRLACRGFCPCRALHSAPHIATHSAATRRFRDRGGGRRSGGAGRGGASDTRVAGSESCELDKMANRLLDWFSVLMEEAGGVAPPLQGFPRDCKPEVRWMFSHLDVAGDGLLSHDDLYALRHDERERCLRPFLASCGRGVVSRGARGGRGARGRGAEAHGLTLAPTCRRATRAASTCRGSAMQRSACAGAWTRTAWSGPPRAPRDSPPAPPLTIKSRRAARAWRARGVREKRGTRARSGPQTTRTSPAAGTTSCASRAETRHSKAVVDGWPKRHPSVAPHRTPLQFIIIVLTYV